MEAYPHFYKKKKGIFLQVLWLKSPKLLLNALFGPQIHALDSILSKVNIESGLKGFFAVCWVHIQGGVNPSDKIDISEHPKTVFFFFLFFFCLFVCCFFFQNRGNFTNE